MFFKIDLGRVTEMEYGRIAIFETTLRDGAQSPDCLMFLEEKIDMTLQFERLVVDVNEAPIAALCRKVEMDIARASGAPSNAKRSRIQEVGL